jgi:hypothetical protein
MGTSGDGGMERVDLFGHVDGIQLEPDKTKPPAIPPAGAAPNATLGVPAPPPPGRDSTVAPKSSP